MNEEIILQSFVVALWIVGLLIAMICELYNRRKEFDDLTKFKLKKVTLFAFKHFLQNDSKKEAKRKAISFAKEVLKNNELNQKYNLVKGA